MRDAMPTWPQTLIICAFAMIFIVCGYYLSRVHGNWGPSSWALLAFLLLAGTGFVAALFLFYLRPQYGAKAFPFLLALLLGHGAVVAVMWKMGILG